MTATRAVQAPVLVQRMRWWDIEEVHALEKVLFGPDAWTVGQLWSELARVPESRWYVVARSEGRLIGYAGTFAVGPEVDVQTVAVAGDAQGRGIGRLLVQHIVEHSRRAGAQVIHLEVRADNAPALALYERLGFVATGRRRDYYGRGRDALLMSRQLAVEEVRRDG